jgi:hypothetical protein
VLLLFFSLSFHFHLSSSVLQAKNFRILSNSHLAAKGSAKRKAESSSSAGIQKKKKAKMGDTVVRS